MGVGHTYEDAAYGADALLVDWSEEALGTANYLMGENYYSRQTLHSDLLAQGFAPSEADYAVSSYDWYDEAFYFAYDLVQSLGYTEEEAYNELINYGFTSDEAVYGSYYAVN
jgi:hypothetical protein